LIIKDSKYQRPDQRRLQVKSVEKRDFHGPWKSALKEQKLKDHKNLEQNPTKKKKIKPEKIQNLEEKRGLKEPGCKSKSSKILYC
jgi:hypothetical protein